MVNKRLVIGVGCMLVGGVLVITGLLDVPRIVVIKVLIGGALGFIGYRIFESRRRGRPEGMEYGKKS